VAALATLAGLAASLGLAPVAAQSDGPRARPFTAENFEQVTPRGFGDRNNSWPQAMIWWKDALYVGTARQSICTSLFGIYQVVWGTVNKSFADTWVPYPPPDPDLSCAPQGWDLSLQAEIWRWTPRRDWERVFQSPLELDNPGTGSDRVPAPPAGKKLPYDIAFRGLLAHTDPDGTEALYAFGVNSTVLWDRTKLPSPRILRSTDGINFTAVPQTPGTFLADLPFNPDHSSFRSPVSHRGKIFVLSGPIFGQGSLIGSADPARGDNAWFLASPPDLLFYELASFNGWLYLGAFNPQRGYSVLKTRAIGLPPYEFVTVVPPGAGLTVRPSASVVSMQVRDGRLYVGTATQAELVRINPDDTWDLVVGPPRAATLPNGTTEWKYPLSGLDAGFGHTLNDHIWQMDDPLGYLYLGTYNASTGARLGPFGPTLLHNMGAHLYRTSDDWYVSAVMTDGFAAANDPLGGIFDFGIRTMASTPRGFFIGATNDYYGLAIFRALKRDARRLDAPQRLDVEPTRSGGALLSWRKSPFDMRGSPGDEDDAERRVYRVWRAPIKLILVRDDTNVEGWTGQFGNKIPDTYVGVYEQIGISTTRSYIDATVVPGERYMYYVDEVENRDVSNASNLATFPLLAPSITFAGLSMEVERLNQRGRFRSAEAVERVRRDVALASVSAAGCKIGESIWRLRQVETAQVSFPDSRDFSVIVAKLVRRLQLYARLPGELVSNEFCR
jgi:hypothetical protein